jgi:hypothetical protein
MIYLKGYNLTPTYPYMFSWIYKFRDDGRHGCGMRWCWSCKTAHALWKAKSPFVNIAKVSKHFHGTYVNFLNKSGLEILAILQDHDVGADALLQHLTDMFGPLPDLKKVVDMFIRLHKGLHKKVEVVETVQVDGKLGKCLMQYSLYDRLAHCANLKGEGECHTGCLFHDESLLVHLIAAAVFAAISAMHVSDEVAYAAFVTALFHDCGKPASKKGGEGLCPQHYSSTVSNPCNHGGPDKCQHHGCSNINTSVVPPTDWSPFNKGIVIMSKIRQFLMDNQCHESIIDPPMNTQSWKIPELVKDKLPPYLHNDFDAMIKACSRPCDCARYPGHGLLGAICLTLFNDVIASTMSDTMTPMDRLATVEGMIRTVQIHMALHNCGNVEVCRKVLAHENHIVRLLAPHMYVGDNLGKIRSKEYQGKVPFVEAYAQFVANMEFLPVHASLVDLNPGQKVTFLLQGQSGSGKSAFVQRMYEFLHECHRIQVISRDKQIAGVITGNQERLTGKNYVLMYAVYNACKTYQKSKTDITRVRDTIINAQSHGLQLSSIFTSITDSDVPDVMQLVDTAFTNAYHEALDNPAIDVIVVDTCITMWETAVQKHLSRLSETIVITVPIINFAGIVSTANGLGEQEQLRLSGPNTMHVPANGVFASTFFDPIGKHERNTAHQAPPVILMMNDGAICPRDIPTLNWIASALGDKPIIHPTQVDTSDMNGGEFFQHLVDKHEGDTLKVRNKLFEIWDVTTNGIYPVESLSPTKKDNIVANLVKYASILHEQGVIDAPITKEEFERDDKLFWNTIMSISVVKYKDGHNGSKFWVNEFMRHFRGITIFTHPITKKVTVLRYLMDRGAEIHSKVTNKRATRQDECDTNGVNLDHISRCLLEDLPLIGLLTQKADGSQGTATVFSGMALNIMKAYVETWGTDVAKEVARKSLEMTDGKFMVVIATQGTKSLSADMTGFATTSIFGGICDEQGKPLVSREEMSTNTPLQIWQKHGTKFLERVFAVHGPAYEKYPDYSITLMFEMICAENRDAFPGGKFHDEFACNATKDQFLFLGLGYASLEVNIPHCVIDIKGVFQQPAFWKITNGSQVSDMIRDLQLVMSGEMTKQQFITTYSPVNPDEFDELHPEGFVLYGHVSAHSTPIHQAYELPGILTYAKVKTLMYYMAHKFKVENLEALVNYGRISPGHFPLCDTLYSIYSSGMLQNLLTQIHGEIRKMIDVEDKQSPLMMAITDLESCSGAFGMHPLIRLERISIKSTDIPTSFVGALLKEQTTPKDLALSHTLANMLTGLFIRGWNATFNTSIQTLEEVKQVEKDGTEISLSAKARKLHDERVALAMKAIYTLLQSIKDAKPWNEKWQTVAKCNTVPDLLQNKLIKQMVELQNKPLLALPIDEEE